jgi:hypothetical protein
MIAIKKHSYLLLELLIAVTLLSLFLVPVLSSPFSHIKRQKQEIISLSFHKEGERLLFLVEEKLRQGEISWKEISESQKEKVFLDIPSLSKIKPTIFLQRTMLNETEDGSLQGLTTVKVEFIYPTKKKNTYTASSTFFVCRKTLDMQLEPKDLS